jgi:hypothetical protein
LFLGVFSFDVLPSIDRVEGEADACGGPSFFLQNHLTAFFDQKQASLS